MHHYFFDLQITKYGNFAIPLQYNKVFHLNEDNFQR